ncbi:astacin, partial [Ancylostoma caninum]
PSETGRHRRQAFRNPNAKWKNGVVEYTFAPNTPENVKNIFKKATEVWSKTTCLDIHENANAQAKIVVARGPGCMSSLGMQGKAQGLMLGDKCLTVR